MLNNEYTTVTPAGRGGRVGFDRQVRCHHQKGRHSALRFPTSDEPHRPHHSGVVCHPGVEEVPLRMAPDPDRPRSRGESTARKQTKVMYNPF